MEKTTRYLETGRKPQSRTQSPAHHSLVPPGILSPGKTVGDAARKLLSDMNAQRGHSGVDKGGKPELLELVDDL